MTMKTRLTQLGVALVCAAAWAPLAAPAQEPAAPAAEQAKPETDQKAMAKRMAARVPKLISEIVPEMVAYLREVHDKESADKAAPRLMVDLHAVMGMGEYLDAMGADTEEALSPEMMKLIMETHQQESRLQKEKFYGSALMMCAWDDGCGADLPEPTPAEKEAAGKLLAEMDARKVEDILATVKDAESADAAGRALFEKMAVASLLAEVGYVPQERQVVQLSEKELAQLATLEAAWFYDSPLLMITACELVRMHRRHHVVLQGQVVDEIMLRRQQDLDEFLTHVRQAEKVRLYADSMSMENGEWREKEWELSAEEWQAMKDILCRTKLIPVKKIEVSEHVPLVNGVFFEIRLMDAKGEQIKSRSIYAWESEAGVKSRRANYADYVEKNSDSIWVLSDEDYAALHQLPTVKAAKEWQDS